MYYIRMIVWYYILQFLEFVKLKFLNDLKTNLPRGLLYIEAGWPKPPPALREVIWYSSIV